MKKITREDLVGLNKLEPLNLSRNNLKSLPDDLFINMPKLRQIYFASNEVEIISSKVLEPLRPYAIIEVIELRNNVKIEDYYYNSHHFKTIEKLMESIDD